MDLEALLELERAGWTALCDGTAGDFYGALMTDDGVMVLANGQVMTRGDVVEALASSPTWSSYRIENPRLVSTGGGAALVYVGTARRDDDSTFTAVMTSVYVRDGDRVRLALYTQTPTT